MMLKYLYRYASLSRYFIKEAYVVNKAIYYRGNDDVLRVIYAIE